MKILIMQFSPDTCHFLPPTTDIDWKLRHFPCQAITVPDAARTALATVLCLICGSDVISSKKEKSNSLG
jgi:hypothetical protein